MSAQFRNAASLFYVMCTKHSSLQSLFREPVHFTMDNHFSGENVIQLLGSKGYKATFTTRRDRLIQGVPTKYFHHRKTEVSHRSKAARFDNPIVAVKHVKQPPNTEAKDYRVVVCSFQSTGSTNITTINALDKVDLYVAERVRGRGEARRKWGIEMNEARQLYLASYYAVDKIDQKLHYHKFWMRTWKWWHHAAFHAHGMGMAVAHDLYLECASGVVNPEWKIDKPVGGPAWRTRLSEQMVRYDPVNLDYPGDDKIRSVTKTNKKRRGKRKGEALTGTDGKKRVSYEDYVDRAHPRGRGAVSRFCMETSDVFKKHLQSMKICGAGKCEVCNERTFWRCNLCGARMCFKSGESVTTMSCVLDYHSEDHLGLTRTDRKTFFGDGAREFNGVAQRDLQANRKHIKALRKRKRESGDD